MKRSINNISNTSTITANATGTVSPFDRSVSIAVNQLIKSTNLLVEVDVKPDIIYKKLKGIVSSNKGKLGAIKECFHEKLEDLKESK